MARVPVSSYRCVWNQRAKVGSIFVIGANGRSYPLRFDIIENFNLCLDLLRNEKPVFIDTDNPVLSTGPEPTGEGDGNLAAAFEKALKEALG